MGRCRVVVRKRGPLLRAEDKLDDGLAISLLRSPDEGFAADRSVDGGRMAGVRDGVPRSNEASVDVRFHAASKLVPGCRI